MCKGNGCKGLEGELKCLENEDLNNFVNYQDYVKLFEVEDNILGNIQEVKSLVDSREYLVKEVLATQMEVQNITSHLECLLKA